MILHTLLGSSLGILFICTLMFIFLYVTQHKLLTIIHGISSCERQNPYTPRTGDLVLVQYKSSGMSEYPKGYNTVPTHCGMVWVKQNIAYVIEATRIGGVRPIQDKQWNKQRDGIRVVLLSDLIMSIDEYCAIRPLVSGRINSKHLEHHIEYWARNLEFEPTVSPTMDAWDILTLGFGPLYPFFGHILASITGLSAKRSEVFCSEFLSLLLHRLGHIQTSFSHHWSLSPLSLTSGLARLDALSKLAPKPLTWGKEIVIVCK